MAKKRRRTYKGPDWYLTERSQILHDLFGDDKANFSAYDLGFADPFQADWQDAIDAAIAFEDDDAVQADIGIETVNVGDLMNQCRDKYKDVIYFAEKAFGAKSPKLKAFGKGRKYEASSRSQGKMRNFMDELHKAAEKHKAALILAGFTQLKIDEIGTLRDSFATTEGGQNVLKTDRLEISQERLDINNTLYTDFTAKVVKAAKRVFKNDAAKLAQYIYNPPIAHRPPAVVYRKILQPGEVANIVNEGIDNTKTIRITNASAKTSKVRIQVDLATGPEIIVPDAPIFPPQRTALITPDLIPPAGPYFINAKNLSTTRKATVRISVRDAI